MGVVGRTVLLSSVLAVTACAQSSKPGDDASAHQDTPSVVIDSAATAYEIAAIVYRLVALDVPYTASVSMTDTGEINQAACASGGITGEGGMIMEDGRMIGGMNMRFEACALAGSPSGHAVVVDGACFNRMDDGGETVSGEEVSFTVAGVRHSLHGFAINRADQRMFTAKGYVHGLGAQGDQVASFSTPTRFDYDANGQPVAGSLLIGGAQDSSIRLTVVDAGQFTLSSDLDGDGMNDDQQNYSWAGFTL